MAEPETEIATDSGVTDAAPVADTPTEDDLDALLREFDEGTAATNPQPIDQAERDRVFNDNLRAHTESLQIDARKAELQQAEQQLRAEYDQRDAAAAFAEIRGSLSPELFDDAMIDSWITSQAVRDRSIHQAWLNRGADRKTYERILNKLAGEFADKFRRYQPEAEVDRAAVAQAVRGQGGKVPAEPPPNFARMSDAELAAWKRDNMPGY